MWWAEAHDLWLDAVALPTGLAPELWARLRLGFGEPLAPAVHWHNEVENQVMFVTLASVMQEHRHPAIPRLLACLPRLVGGLHD